MKKIIIGLFAICLLSTYANASDPYGEGYDDAREGQGEWSVNNEYLDGYEDGQREREDEEYEEYIERERQEREEQRRRNQGE